MKKDKQTQEVVAEEAAASVVTEEQTKPESSDAQPITVKRRKGVIPWRW